MNHSPIQKRRIADTLSYMEKNYDKKITLNNLCENVSLKKAEFCREFREETGKSPIDYLLWLRIEKAKFFLLDGTHKIGEVAYLCGFYGEFYFSKTFKRYTGLSPREFKKHI